MRKNLTSFASIFLAALLFVGCFGSKGESSSTSTTSNGAEASILQDWQSLYYEFTIQELSKEDAVWPEKIALLQGGGHQPVLGFFYKKQETPYKLYTLVDKEVVQIFEGTGGVVGLSLDSGNPIVSEHGVVYEVSKKGRAALYEYRDVEGTPTELYTYADDKVWAFEEWIIEAPLEKLNILREYNVVQILSDKHSLSMAQVKSKLSDYFLNTYVPKLPQGAPEWIKVYMQYIHNHLFTPYIPNSTFSLGQIVLREPLQQQGAPIVESFYSQTDVGIGGNYILIDGRVDFWGDGAEGGYSFYKDAQGKTIVCESNYLTSNWYTVDQNKKMWLFASGMIMYGEYFTFAGSNTIKFGNEGEPNQEEMFVWIEEKKQETLTKFGYVGELTELDRSTYILPNEATWPELEKALITIFCQYAKDNGMWAQYIKQGERNEKTNL